MDEPRQSQSLSRTLGLITTVALVVGSVIGSGIFKKPALMAGQLGSSTLLVAVWVVAGIVTLFGALTNTEVAGMITATGGQYEYFRKMYGDFIAWLYGWAVFIVIQTGSIASITYVFSEYSQYFWTLPRLPADVEQSFAVHLPFIGTLLPLANLGVKGLTIAVILSLTLVNYLGVRFGGAVQVTFTTLKVLAILLLVGAGFLASGGPETTALAAGAAVPPAPAVPMGLPLVLAFAAAMSGAFWAYDGWNNVTYVAGEVKEPQRTIPRGLIIGTLIVIAVYVLVNLAYVHVLSIGTMAGSDLVASDMARKVLGGFGAGFVAAAVMLSTFGTSNGTILVSARVYFAMARRGRFFSPVGRIHPVFRTPGVALWLQGIWASVLVLSGTFDTLTDMLIFVSWIFYALGAAGIFVLRRSMPDAPRPYRVPLYPYLPAVFVIFAAIYVLLTLCNDIASYAEGSVPIINSVFGLVLVAAGLPFYLWFRSRNGVR